MEKLWTDFALSWAMLTRIPLPKSIAPQTAALPSAGAMLAMPVAGALFSLLVGLPTSALAWVTAASPAAWIGCGIYALLGWTLHLDGWGDLWDGIGSGKRGEEMRRIMKDSSTGAFGTAGIVLAIGIRAATLAAIPLPLWIPAHLAAGGIGRFASTVAAYRGIYPWQAGMGRNFVSGFTRQHLMYAFLVTCLLIPFAPLACILGIALSAAAGMLLALWGNKTLGGVNGDILGAAAAAGELLTLLAFLI